MGGPASALRSRSDFDFSFPKVQFFAVREAGRSPSSVSVRALPWTHKKAPLWAGEELCKYTRSNERGILWEANIMAAHITRTSAGLNCRAPGLLQAPRGAEGAVCGAFTRGAQSEASLSASMG